MLLFGAGIAGLVAVNRRKRSYFFSKIGIERQGLTALLFFVVRQAWREARERPISS